VEPIAWMEGSVRLLDQTRLPDQETYLDIDDYPALAEAARRVRAKGYEIGNVDCTIIAQAPKLMPFMPRSVSWLLLKTGSILNRMTLS